MFKKKYFWLLSVVYDDKCRSKLSIVMDQLTQRCLWLRQHKSRLGRNEKGQKKNLFPPFHLFKNKKIKCLGVSVAGSK